MLQDRNVYMNYMDELNPMSYESRDNKIYCIFHHIIHTDNLARNIKKKNKQLNPHNFHELYSPPFNRVLDQDCRLLDNN